MPKGRRPLPSAVKNLRGNPGKRKNESEPDVLPGDPTMPVGLSEAAQQEWRDITPHLRTMGVLTPADGKALAAYCYTYNIWMMANKDVVKYGVMIDHPVFGRKGTPEESVVIARIVKKNPAVAVANEALKTMKSYLVEFGMTPSSRSKLHVEKPNAVDAADAYFNKKLFPDKHVN